MRSLWANLLSLVLPAGATSGPRLVLDGPNAQFLLYNLAGLLYASLTPAEGIQVFDPTDPSRYLRLDTVAGDPVIIASTGDAGETTAALINTVTAGAGAARQLGLDIDSPFFGDRGRITLRSDSFDGTVPSRVRLDAGELEVEAAVAHTITDTTDASGFITFTHGAAHTPKIVAVSHESPLSGPAAFCSGVDSIGATTARARFLAISAGSVVSHATASATFRVLTIV